MIKFTPNLWQKILGFTVLDPDGWDRKSSNFSQDWETPISFTEFMDRADESTCTSHPDREIMRRVALNNIVPNIPNAREEIERFLK